MNSTRADSSRFILDHFLGTFSTSSKILYLDVLTSIMDSDTTDYVSCLVDRPQVTFNPSVAGPTYTTATNLYVVNAVPNSDGSIANTIALFTTATSTDAYFYTAISAPFQTNPVSPIQFAPGALIVRVKH